MKMYCTVMKQNLKIYFKTSNFPMMGDIQFFLIRDSNNLIKDIEKYSKNLSSIPNHQLLCFYK